MNGRIEYIKEKLKMLPKSPGCYQMKNSDGEIIYVGKAKILFNRVKSYFIGAHDFKTTKLVSEIYDFEYIITSTEAEAFVLEINLIKKYNPKYNIMLTDDKRYPYICISNEANPKIFYTRDLSKKAKYYGPYPDASAARDVVDLLNRMFPLRKCRVIPKKECLYYHLGQCLAPCINTIEKQKYQEITSKIQSFLKGNIKEEIKRLQTLMSEASEELDYEKALEYLKVIQELEVIAERQKMELDINDTDIFGYAVKEEYLSIQIFHIRGNKMTERSGFLFDVIDDVKEMFVNFIIQFYTINNNPIPKEILLPNIDVDLSLIEQNIAIRETSFKLNIPKQGRKKELVELVTVNATEKLDNLILKDKRKYDRTYGAIEKLGELLNIEAPKNIEAFDNSNIQGVSPISAMVSYVDGLPNKKEYRKYNIKTVIGQDDAQTMYEVVTRRYKRLKQENKKMPNLIIMDGGKPQVNAALKALKELDLNLNVLGLVKNEFHKTEALLFNSKEIIIDKKSGLFLFLESLQDEVHRYAIAFHHTTHSKNTFSTKLDDIKGIGKVKKKQILSILKEENFKELLDKLRLTKEQKEEILKIYNLR